MDSVRSLGGAGASSDESFGGVKSPHMQEDHHLAAAGLMTNQATAAGSCGESC